MFTDQQNPTVGTQVTHLVQMLALKNQWTKAYTTEYMAAAAGFGPDIVYKWRQNRLLPSEETLEILLHLGCDEAQLEREWGLALIRAARSFELLDLVDQLWEPEVYQEIPHNLPKPTYTEFVGRHGERQRLLELLEPATAAPLIMVDGIGGVGKTALVLKVAYDCLQASSRVTVSSQTIMSEAKVNTPLFAVIIFVSAKQKYLTADGILPRAYAPDTLRSMYREIGYVLDLDLTQTQSEELPSQIRHALSRQRTLLIVDNLETVEDKDSVLAFLYDLPAQVKVVITTREQRFYTPIQLSSLSEAEGICLIGQEAAKQQLQITSATTHQLYNGTGGIPAAIIYGIGQLAAGREIDNVLKRMADHEGDVARFFFHDAVAPLRGRPAHQLLMAIALFTKQPKAALAFRVAALADDPQRANEAEVQLLRLSLIHKEEQHFIIHPLTREYTLAELAAQVEFDLAARQRWLMTYTQFVTESVTECKGEGAEWAVWYDRYCLLEEEWDNLYAVMCWCMEQRRYAEFVQFWQSTREFMSIYVPLADRLQLVQWLIPAAERHGDRQTQVEALHEKALILMVSGREEQHKEVECCLVEAWVLRHDVCPELQSYIADTFAEYYTELQQYREATSWLEIATGLCGQMTTDTTTKVRKEVHTLYRRAICLMKMNDITQAQEFFIQVQTMSKQIGWSRLYYCVQTHLAEIAILRNDLGMAECLLLDGLRIVECNRDRRHIACYKRVMAVLAQQHAQLTSARDLAKEAQELFDTLGMDADAEQVSHFLETVMAE